MPVFNVPLWFLALLVSTELLHYFAGRFLRSDFRLIAGAAGFYAFGYYLNLRIEFFQPNSFFVGSFWFVNEVPVVYAFYLVGVLMRRRGIFLKTISRPVLVAGIAASFLAVLFTFDRNTGPFVYLDAVVIMLSGHGHVLLFPFTALAGSLLLLLLAKASGESRLLMFLGKNTIILFCLNGVFYHFFNQPWAAWAKANLPASAAAIFGFGTAATLVSLLLCFPVVVLFSRYFPQLVSRPAVHGPVLKPLV